MAVDDCSFKECTNCGARKPLSEFYKRSTSKDGARRECKTCRKAIDAAYRVANGARDKARAAAYNKAHPEKARARVAAWSAANPESPRLRAQNRRARRRKNGGTLSKGLALRLFKLQKGKCPCCQQPLGDDYHLDHIHPLSLGGSNTDDNVQLLRQRCNIQKGFKHPTDFMQSRGFLL